MKIVKTTNKKAYKEAMDRLADRLFYGSNKIEKSVAEIIKTVRKKGDEALFEYTEKFDNASYTSRTVKVNSRDIDKAEKEVDQKLTKALGSMAKRITKYHKPQKSDGYTLDEFGSKLAMRITPLQSAGVYTPGGKASYPSSVLMNVIPAKIAGVNRIAMTTPAPNGEINPAVLVAAKIAGVDEIYKVGGAQAIAALAYGTKTIEPVDKIVGPGNAYVAEAKRQVFGRVDIDMIAGPSEVLVLADDTADPAHVAADLIAQAEHDEMAYSILVTTSEKLAKDVLSAVETQLEILPRKKIASVSLKQNGYIFLAKDLEEAFDLSNKIAPEHFELVIKNGDKQANKVTSAGALFIGHSTPEALGDYLAGSNHTLPTGGSARFASPLGVYDFQKRTSVLNFTKDGLKALGERIITVANSEGLKGHARAVELRLRD